VLLLSDPHTHKPILLPYNYRLLNCELLNFITFRLLGSFILHAPCHVTYHREGGRNGPHFRNPRLKFTSSLCHLQCAKTNTKLCYWRQLRLSHCGVYRVHCTCAVSRDLCIGGPPKSILTILDPELSIHNTTFMGLRRGLKVLL